MSVPHIPPRRRLGQHFLQDPNYVRKIVNLLDVRDGDALLEIGPGEGALTQTLTGRGRSLTVIDIDPRVTAVMRSMFPNGDVEVIEQDFLHTDLEAFAAGHPGRIRIVGNIPYNITTPILFHVLDHRRPVYDVTVMIQKEVARRLIAHPSSKEYGILSVVCGYCAEVEVAFDVPPTAFYPRPGVVSSVVRLTMDRVPRVRVIDEEFFRSMVRAVFGKRRKTLRNSLQPFAAARGYLIPTSARLGQRPEELSIEELAELSDTITSFNRNMPEPGPSGA
jgi:16S rRNA (adenine1518-N6/adenine1519-N6)-dimethyltransferase